MPYRDSYPVAFSVKEMYSHHVTLNRVRMKADEERRTGISVCRFSLHEKKINYGKGVTDLVRRDLHISNGRRS